MLRVVVVMASPTLMLLLATGAQSLQIDTGAGVGPEAHASPAVDADPSIYGPWSPVPWRMPRMTAKSVVAPATWYPRAEIVNLDLPPAQRWVALMKKYRAEMIPYVAEYQKILNQHIEINQDEWHKAFWDQLDFEYKAEVDSMVQTLDDPVVTPRVLSLFDMMYELGSPMGCSEIVAAAKDGTVLHGRNLDYREVSPAVEVTFMRHGKVLYVSPMFLGTNGVHTGIKPGSWSFGQNTRFDIADNPFMNLARLKKRTGVIYPTFIRKLFEQDNFGYDEALATLQNQPLVRGGYFIIAGSEPYQGAVITRAASPVFKNTRVLNPQQWYLIQTNDDAFGFPLDFRRSVGTMAIQSTLTQDTMTPQMMIHVMKTPVVYMKENVVLFMMSPKSGDYCSILGPAVPNDDHSVRCPMLTWRTKNGAHQAIAASISHHRPYER